MRLWSIHPQYLDAQGLIAWWREGLLAQAVLLGFTRGYLNHPQLLRFKNEHQPLAALSHYLQAVYKEAQTRGFNFDYNKLFIDPSLVSKMPITTGQLTYELQHLRKKLLLRDPERYQQLAALKLPEAHPSFDVVEGPVASWETIARP